MIASSISAIRSYVHRFSLILLCERPCTFLLLLVQLSLPSGAVWWTSQQALLIHWQFHKEPACLICISLISYEECQPNFLINWVLDIQIFIVNRRHNLFLCFHCMLTPVFLATII